MELARLLVRLQLHYKNSKSPLVISPGNQQPYAEDKALAGNDADLQCTLST